MSLDIFLTNPFIIDKKLSIPFYIQIKKGIQNLIKDNLLKPGDKLPGEYDLSNYLKTSRMTVRNALKELEKEGYVKIKKENGTFVRKINKAQTLIKLDGFTRDMSKLGIEVTSKTLEIKKISYNEKYKKIYHTLNENNLNFILKIKRIRLLDNKSYAVENSFLPSRFVDNLLKTKIDNNFSIYKYFEKTKKINLNHAEHIIEPKLSDKKLSDILNIKIKSPVLFISGTTFSNNNFAVEYLEGYYLGDRYKLVLNVEK